MRRAVERVSWSLPCSEIMFLGASKIRRESTLAHMNSLKGSNHPDEVVRCHEHSMPPEGNFYLFFSVVDDVWMFVYPACGRGKRSESLYSITVEVRFKAAFIIRI